MKQAERRLEQAGLCLSLSFCALLSACMPKDRGASSAYEDGDYERSAEIYHQLSLEKPGDAGLRERRDQARSKVYARRLAKVRAAGAFEPTLAALGELLTLRQRWTPGDPSLGLPALDSALATIEEWVRQTITAELRGQLASRHLLAASVVLDARRGALPFDDFAALWPLLENELTTAATARCKSVLPGRPEDAPYLASLVSAYCITLRAPAPAPVALGLASGLQVAVSVEGMTEAQHSAAQRLVSALFAESAWHDYASPSQLTGEVTGKNEYRFTTREEELEAPWQESVSYQDTETYQESYTEMEHYTEQVPTTVYRTESYRCGSYNAPSTCTRQVPSTEYRTQSGTRPVTKQRTAKRNVTRYRTEERLHTYRALRRDGAYQARWQVELQFGQLPGGPALRIPVTVSASQYGYDHDETFEAAQLAPGRANLMTSAAWFDYVLGQLEDKVRDQLEARWRATFCNLSSYDAETAARCARGSQPPAAARAALAAVFGGDTDVVLQRLTRWGTDPRAPRPPLPATSTIPLTPATAPTTIAAPPTTTPALRPPGQTPSKP